MDIISNYIIINYLNCLLEAATSLRVSSGWQRQAAANLDVSPNLNINKQLIHRYAHSLYSNVNRSCFGRPSCDLS